MDERQRTIQDWMRTTMRKHKIRPRAWAELAKLGKDTVSRALKPDYQHVTSTRTLTALAAALGEPSPLGSPHIPSARALLPIVDGIGQIAVQAKGLPPDVAMAFAEALRDTLLHVAEHPDDGDNPQIALALIRSNLRRLES